MAKPIQVSFGLCRQAHSEAWKWSQTKGLLLHRTNWPLMAGELEAFHVQASLLECSKSRSCEASLYVYLEVYHSAMHSTFFREMTPTPDSTRPRSKFSCAGRRQVQASQAWVRNKIKALREETEQSSRSQTNDPDKSLPSTGTTLGPRAPRPPKRTTKMHADSRTTPCVSFQHRTICSTC